MANNKFIERLKGQPTAGSLVEIKNTSAKTSFANMPNGTSNANDVYSDHRGNATIVANGTLLWKVDGKTLESVESVYGDGKDFSSVQSVSGSGLWLNASYTFPSTGDPNHPVAMVFNPNTKWVLKLCGDNLIVDGGNVVDFTLIVKIGSAHIFSKNFKVAEHAGQFSTEFILDFKETNTGIVKAGGLAKMTLQLLCGTENASARIYNGMTVLTCLQRKVDAYAVSSTNANVQDVLDGNIVPDDYFSNPKFIDQIEDGKDAYAVFNRDGDNVFLSGWTPKEDVATAAQLDTEIQNRISADDALGLRIDNEATARESADNALGARIDNVINDLATETTARENADTALQGQITSNKNAIDAHVADTANPHNVTKAQVGLGNVDNTSDLNKPISTATQTALDLKADKSTTYTKTETDTLLGAKQDTISDLSTIRSNAQAGKAASDTIATYGNIVTHNVSEFATAAQGAKADTAIQPGYNVSELVNDAGYLTQHQTLADLGITATASEINVLDGITASTTELNYTDGVTSNIQTQLNSKQATISDLATIRSGASAGATAVQPGDLATVATTGSYNDLSDKPTIPTVNNATLTIQKNGTTVQTFTANQSTNATANISVPTKTSDITNDSGFITSSALAPYALSADLATVATSGSYNDLSNKPTIPTVGNGTITITQGGITKGTFTTNQSGDTTVELDAGGGSSSSYHPDLFDHKWADHQLNDVSWLRADTFSWQSGDVYTAAYNHLIDEIDAATPQTDTIGDITITYYLAEDGHKICLPYRESDLVALYEATGVAWYYILDVTNRRFKLPRTKWGFTGIRSGVGGYVEAGLPNITGSFSTASDKNLGKGAFSWTNNKYSTNGGGQGGQWGINFSAKKSNSIYGNSDTVQPKATEMYLYFYVGNFTQTAIEQTAGLNAEMFNDLNAHKVIEFQAPTSANNYTWYRKYADGWVEQGGRALVPATNGLSSSSVTVTLPVPIATPEQATLAYNGMGSTEYYANCADQATVTTTTASIGRWNNGNPVAEARYYNWTLSGMAA